MDILPWIILSLPILSYDLATEGISIGRCVESWQGFRHFIIIYKQSIVHMVGYVSFTFIHLYK